MSVTAALVSAEYGQPGKNVGVRGFRPSSKHSPGNESKLANTSMSYAIDERNSERQQLLAQMLNPLTRQVLDRIDGDSITKFLDLGCGQGHTTRMLARQFRIASGTCFEYDAALVAQASADPSNPPGIVFQQG